MTNQIDEQKVKDLALRNNPYLKLSQIPETEFDKARRIVEADMLFPKPSEPLPIDPSFSLDEQKKAVSEAMKAEGSFGDTGGYDVNRAIREQDAKRDAAIRSERGRPARLVLDSVEILPRKVG